MYIVSMTKEEQNAFDATVAKNKELNEEVLKLKSQLQWFQRQVYGHKSERFVDSDQQSLDLGVESKKIEPEYLDVEAHKKKRKKTPHGREDIPDHIPRITTTIYPDLDITGLDIFDIKVTEYLEYIPAQYYVRRTVRPVYILFNDSGERSFVYAELPAHCIDKGKAGASLVAQTIISKCIDYTPLYRYSQQISRDCDFTISHTTLQGWYERGVFWLEAICRAILAKIQSAEYLQIDETTLKVILKPKKGKTKTAHMWLYYDLMSKCVLFDFSLGRGSDNLKRILDNTPVSTIQSDGWSAYAKFTKENDISSAGCMAHARRKFYDALAVDKKYSPEILAKIKVLFKIEDFAKKEQYTFEQRLDLRIELSKPIIDSMKTWCEDVFKKTVPSSKLGEALTYMLNQWDSLTYFLKDGRVELSNNWIENKVRPFALGRKNFLFAGSKTGGERLATIYTVITTAQLHGLNVRDYLTALFEELPKRNQNDIDDLLPWNWEPKESKNAINVDITKSELSKTIVEKDISSEKID